MQLPHGRGDLLACLAKVAELLKLEPEIPHKKVILISDFQRATWAAGATEDAARVRGLLQTDRRGGQTGADRCRAERCGQRRGDGVRVARRFCHDGAAGPLQSHTAKFRPRTGDGPAARVSGRRQARRTARRRPECGRRSSRELFDAVAYGGEHRVLVRLQKDALPLDDQRWLAVPVKERIRVLCVNGGSSGSAAAARATDYLELALAPGRQWATPACGGGRRSLIEPTVISEGELQGFDLATYDCVFFCNVRMFTEREAQIIETYLKGGGGVVWCLGDQVSPRTTIRSLPAGDRQPAGKAGRPSG